MIVGMKIIYISWEDYATGIYLHVYCTFWHISHFRCTSILNRCALKTWKITKHTVRSTRAISGEVLKISFLPEPWLCQSFGHLTRLTWLIFQAITMPGCCISWLVTSRKISAEHLICAPGLWFGWFPVLQKVLELLTKHGISWLELCCIHSRMLT